MKFQVKQLVEFTGVVEAEDVRDAVKKFDWRDIATVTSQIVDSEAFTQATPEDPKGTKCPLCGNVIQRGETHGVGLCP